MKIQGLPIFDVDESEEITMAVPSVTPPDAKICEDDCVSYEPTLWASRKQGEDRRCADLKH